MEKEELIKLRTFDRILNNLGINDKEISKRISAKVKDIELDTFLLVFPINGSQAMSCKDAEKKLNLPSYPQSHGYKNVQKVIAAIFSETGIMLSENNVELIGLNSEDYEKYYSDVSSFFINRGFSKNDTILEIMRTFSVKYFNHFLDVFERKTISQSQLFEKIEIGESSLRAKFSEMKKIIKEKTGLDVFGEKWRDAPIIMPEEFRKEARNYFEEIGIEDEEKIRNLSGRIDQRDFRVLSLRYPLGIAKVGKRDEIMKTLDISLPMAKKSLDRIYGLFYEEDVPFLEIYKKYKDNFKKYNSK